MNKIEGNKFNSNLSRYVSTAESEKKIDLKKVKRITENTKKYNDF